ncbi:hypothetical protein [Marvinbryantia formatexigens]|uniref:hypothetical protein n=1 Tax=Marvinbryantia formatexigens TaxID=168384 RepID=UPI00031727C0|nr:hypothetical protein [Marvinbryantia formatexigens]UWO26151.1 hypothetical protein NQ534_06710 [Marvinbryantia formatexigens DSM 14469]SDF92646.1 hypothetical protein SAMN05660368_01605 [Marvinbryantia formatexigens]
MKKYKNTLLFLMIVLIGLSAVWRYVTLNQKYPNPKITIIPQGEAARIGNYEFVLKDIAWYTGEITEEIIPGYTIVSQNGERYPAEKEKVILVTLGIKKNKADDTVLDLTNIAFEIGAWHNQHEFFLFEALNGKGMMQLELKEQEEKEIVFPVYMLDLNFKKKDWEQLERRAVDVVLNYYPEKIILRSNNK